MFFNDILNKIRFTCFRHLLIPILSLLAAFFLYNYLPFEDVFTPKLINSSKEALFEYEKGTEYVNIKLDTLYYTGFDLMSGDKTVASYYYSLLNNECTFYLIENKLIPEKPVTLKNFSFNAGFSKDSGPTDNMIASFSESLDWNYDSLKKISSPIIIDSTEYNYIVYLFVFILIIAVILYSVAYITANLLFILIPFIHPSLIHIYYLSDKKRMFDAYKDLVEDYNTNKKLIAGDMILTSKYFINLGNNEVSILPLKDIVFGYEHGRLKSLLGIHLKITHNLYFRGKSYFKVEASHKAATNITLVMDYLRENYPDIIWGYTKENRLKAKKIILDSLKQT
jgi:hypothetical protein